MIYYGKYKGNYGFLDSSIITIPKDSIPLKKEYWQKLLLAESKGGSVRLVDNKVIAVDYMENEIDLDNMENKNYSKPKTIKEKAELEMDWIKDQINYTICMDEQFTEEMKEYVKCIKNVINNKLIIEELPNRPDKISMEKKL